MSLSFSLSSSLFSFILSLFSLLLSCLVLSLFLCLSFSVSLYLSLCPCLRVLLWLLLLCLVCMSLWSWCVRAVWCGTLKNPCVHSKRPWCRYTRGRFECTHGGRFERTHRGRGGVSVAHQHTLQHTPTSTHCTPTTHTTHNTEHARCHRQFCLPKFAHGGCSVKEAFDLPQWFHVFATSLINMFMLS